ncbi:trimeric intracellular cation channel type 1B.1-like [Sycon ciliatum]|uniref:trimeric intracellular cation channel type 1B.1-like n=1 Tax=Sycon ciliatum TaxID=27933 RepID=UPI0031F713A5
MEGVISSMQGAGDAFVSLPMFPIFEIIHYFKSAMTTRQEPGAREFAIKHPLSSCVSTLMLVNGGTIVCNLLLGLPLGEPLLNPIRIAIETMIWFVVFFCPGDFVFRFLSTLLPKAVIVVFKDLRRLHQVATGIRVATKLHPNAWALAILAGTARSSGGSLMVTNDRLMRGAKTANQHEFLKPSYHTKCSFFASCALVALDQGLFADRLVIPRSVLMLILALAMITGSLSIVLLGYRDPFCAVSAVILPGATEDAADPPAKEPAAKDAQAKKDD